MESQYNLSTPTALSERDAEEVEVRFAPFAARMREAGLPEIVIETFFYYYRQLLKGQTGLIPEDEIEPVRSLPDVEDFPSSLAKRGEAALAKCILLKLNGGLGTSMGLEQAKSVLRVKHELSFLDIIARQALQSGVPLVLMNSFATHEDSVRALDIYPGLNDDLPLDFLQHHVPKVRQSDLAPVNWPQNRELEWAPPGHGDIYTALITSGMLAKLLEEGYEYAFVSNADNLGASLDTTLLGYFVQESLPFMMECADRTPMDRKGGHLARRCDGRLILRESAQCPAGDMAAFQDIRRHRYFNTNNLWIHLPALQAMLEAQDNILGLPMIRNSKTVDPRDPDSTPVYQLETAMGSAIAIFANAGAVRVPRTRFAPVKSTSDLLAVRSDAYLLDDAYRLVPHPRRRHGHLHVELDEAYYRLVDDMEARFPHGAPSLLDCERLTVRGDVYFGRNVVCQGEVLVAQPQDRPLHIPDGTVLGPIP